MDLVQLIHPLDVRHAGGPSDCRVLDVTDDSRTVLPGSLFVARQGPHVDGRRYIDQAIADGAVAVLTDAEGARGVRDAGAALLVAEDVHLAAAKLAERFYGDPSSKLKLVGVTGTNGKSTIAHLTHGILNHAGVRTGLIGTVTIDDGRESASADLTTPGSIELSRTLASMVDAGCQACVMEASSHALDQRRAAGLHFDMGVFTTLGTDHMDYHVNREAYLAAKRRLFEMLPESGIAIVNADDPACDEMLLGCKARRVNCSAKEGDCRIAISARRVSGMDVVLEGPFGKIESHLPVMGAHNAMNLLQSVQVAHEVGVPAEAIAAGLAQPAFPRGRMEPVPDAAGLHVFIDFAHTPDALECTLSEMRRAMDDSDHEGRLWIVFGCGGNKDTTKRYVMGEVASRLADRIVLTSDNPRTEPPGMIIEAIYAGVDPSRRSDVIKEPAREEAIARAITEAEPGDVVIIAGKGHEKTQELPDGHGGIRVRPFDDAEVVRRCLARRAVSS